MQNNAAEAFVSAEKNGTESKAMRIPAPPMAMQAMRFGVSVMVLIRLSAKDTKGDFAKMYKVI